MERFFVCYTLYLRKEKKLNRILFNKIQTIIRENHGKINNAITISDPAQQFYFYKSERSNA